MEIVNNEISHGTTVMFLTFMIILCAILIIEYRKNKAENDIFKLKVTSTVIGILMIIMLVFFYTGIKIDLDYVFDNTITEIVHVEEIIVSANNTEIIVAEYERTFMMDISREQESYLINYYKGHLCEIERTKNGRSILRIKVIE